MSERDRDGFGGARDPTVIRPTPGAGRPAVSGAAGSRNAAPLVAAGAREGFAIPGAAGSLRDFLAAQRNRLLQWAGPLLVLGERLRGATAPANLEALRRECLEQVQFFETQCRSAGIAEDDVVMASYALCTYVDTAVNSTPWGARGGWFNQSLLLARHQETDGGKKFFVIIGRAVTDMARSVDLAELLYACLALGYEGKFRGDPRGAGELGEIQSQLYRQIAAQRGDMAPPLSPHWQGVQDQRNPILRAVSWWILLVAVLLVWFGGWFGYRLLLAHEAAPIQKALASGGPQVAYADPQPPRRLKQLLAGAETDRLLTVEDFGNRSVVTLNATGLFPSGSAQLAPGFESTFDQIAAAINQLPGRVIVVGHTDDQPVHSYRFNNNFDLSQERAHAVAQLLQSRLSSRSGVEWMGAGSEQPRYTAADTPDYRARNRRVEIVYSEDPGSAP